MKMHNRNTCLVLNKWLITELYIFKKSNSPVGLARLSKNTTGSDIFHFFFYFHPTYLKQVLYERYASGRTRNSHWCGCVFFYKITETKKIKDATDSGALPFVFLKFGFNHSYH
jgi:hypothetical protein